MTDGIKEGIERGEWPKTVGQVPCCSGLLTKMTETTGGVIS